MAKSRAKSKPKALAHPQPSAEPSPPVKEEEDSEPPVSYKRLGINLALLLIISLEAGLVSLARPVWVTQLVAIASLLSTIWGVMAGFVFGWFLGLFGKKLEAKQRALFQSPHLTLYLAGLALLGAAPGAFAVPWVLDPPLLWVLPRGVYNDMTQASDEKDSGFRYVFKVEQGGRNLPSDEGEAVTGRGSLYVGQDPDRQISWIDPNDKAKLSHFTNRPEVLEKWTGKSFRKLIEAPIRTGPAELVLEYCADGSCVEVTRQPVDVKPKVNQIFLDK